MTATARTHANGTAAADKQRLAAIEYFELLWPRSPLPPNYLLFTLPGEGCHWFNNMLDLSAAVPKLAANKNVYLGCGASPENFGPRERCKAAYISAIPGLWADIDIRGPAHKKDNLPPDKNSAIALAYSMPLPPSLIVFSGHGLYPWWLLSTPWIFEDDADRTRAADLMVAWQHQLKSTAEKRGWSIDSTADLARVLRIPGSINRKAEPVPVTFEAPATVRRYSIAEFDDALKSVIVEPPPRAARKTYSPPQNPDDEIQKAMAALSALKPSRADDYKDWLDVGMALQSVSDSLLPAWVNWSQQSSHFKERVCEPKWQSFTSTGGLTIGSLIKWAQADSPGWRPGRTMQVCAAKGPASASKDATIVGVILSHMKAKFDPTFRRGDKFWSGKLNCEIGRGQVCQALTTDIIPALMDAKDFPWDKHGPDRSKVPSIYRQWAPFAWADLLQSLPEEPDTGGEISGGAEEEFQGIVTAALMSIEGFAHTFRDVNSEKTEVQRRSLLDWCRLFAKPGPWQSVRSLSIWCRRGDDGDVQIALHQRLFGQIRRPMPHSHRKFAALCESYGIGVAGRTSRSAFVELAQAFLTDLQAGPCDGACDGEDDVAPHTRTGNTVASHAPSRTPSHAGVNDASEES
jgi:hypothetical protein